MFKSMIAQAAVNEVKFDYVLADNWFSAKKNMEFIHYDMNKKFIISLKSNRSVTLSEDDRKKGQYQNPSTLNLKDGEKRNCFLKEVPFPVALVTKIFKNEDGSTCTLYLVTNDLESRTERIYEIYQSGALSKEPYFRINRRLLQD